MTAHLVEADARKVPPHARYPVHPPYASHAPKTQPSPPKDVSRRHRNLSNVSADGLLYLCARASQTLDSAYAAVPQREFAGSQFHAKGRIGRRCDRGPSPWIWTENADKVRFWTETTDMFGAAFAMNGFFKSAPI
jgi:hypothetical protein